MLLRLLEQTLMLEPFLSLARACTLHPAPSEYLLSIKVSGVELAEANRYKAILLGCRIIPLPNGWSLDLN
jgi:hypothetical protein